MQVGSVAAAAWLLPVGLAQSLAEGGWSLRHPIARLIEAAEQGEGGVGVRVVADEVDVELAGPGVEFGLGDGGAKVGWGPGGWGWATPVADADGDDDAADGVGTAHRPFRPTPIVDPYAEAQELCKDEEFRCTAGHSCRDFPDRICRAYRPCDHRVCLHKNLLPIIGQDLAFLITLLAVATLAGATGIGGGGINVPLLMMLSRFDIKEAVPLSHVAVMGNALAQLLVNVQHRHPDAPHRPLIHHELALLLLPAQLAGNSLGVVVGAVFPPTLLIVLSLVLLAFATLKTLHKGFVVRQEQLLLKRRQDEQLCELTAPEGAPAPQPTVPSGSGIEVLPETSSAAAADQVPVPALVQPPSRSATGSEEATPSTRADSGGSGGPARGAAGAPVARVRIPWKVIGFMVAFEVIFIVDYLAMSKDVSGVKRCSPLYWIAMFGLYPILVGCVWLGVTQLRALDDWHRARGNAPIRGDPSFTARGAAGLACAAALIGLVAGLLGLGGGEFMVPLLLEFGVAPTVAAATSGFLMVFTTSSNVVHYAVAGTIEPFMDWGIACAVMAAAGALIGLFLRDRYMSKSSYPLVFLVAMVLASSGVLLVFRGLLPPAQPDWQFRSFCS